MKQSTAEKADFSAQHVSVHRQTDPFCILVKGYSWAKNEPWKTVSRSKGLVNRKKPGSQCTPLSFSHAFSTTEAQLLLHMA